MRPRTSSRRHRHRRDGILLTGNNQLQYATLALGSALALFLYPHSATGILASRGRNVIKKNMIALPAYSFLLGLLALLGYVAIAAGVNPITNESTGRVDSNTLVPELFNSQFPDWFAGVAYAAIGIGALVPAAIMSIAAANLWTRNIYKEYLAKNATPKQEATQAKWASLVVKFGAVLFILFIDPQFSIDLQLIGGGDHPADPAGRRDRPLHPLVAFQGTHRRVGGWHCLGPLPALDDSQPGHRQGTLRRFGADPLAALDIRLAPVRGIHGADLCRDRRARGQPGGGGPGHRRPADGRRP